MEITRRQLLKGVAGLALVTSKPEGFDSPGNPKHAVWVGRNETSLDIGLTLPGCPIALFTLYGEAEDCCRDASKDGYVIIARGGEGYRQVCVLQWTGYLREYRAIKPGTNWVMACLTAAPLWAMNLSYAAISKKLSQRAAAAWVLEEAKLSWPPEGIYMPHFVYA